MKSVYLLAMFALSFGASAQQRYVYQVEQSPKYQHERREVGRQQRVDPYKQKYDSKDFDYRGLDLSRNQKRELDELLFRMHQDVKIAQRNYRRPESQIRKIEKAYDLKISKVLSKYQYDKFMRMYAYQFSGFGYGNV